MRTISISKKAQKFIQKLQPKQQKQIAKSILALQIDVMPHDTKKLHGYDFHRIDTGEYRIIYHWTDTTISIFIVGKRNDNEVYRELDRAI